MLRCAASQLPGHQGRRLTPHRLATPPPVQVLPERSYADSRSVQVLMDAAGHTAPGSGPTLRGASRQLSNALDALMPQPTGSAGSSGAGESGGACMRACKACRQLH